MTVSTTGPKPIQTWYRGVKFRSRLEARWAVFLDALKVPWLYEHEGYEVSHRLELSDDTFPYLPDFWLPNQKLFVEVKGSLDAGEAHRLLNAAASLSSNDGGGCHDDGGNDLLVLGPIPPERASWTPIRLHMHKGDLEFTPERSLLKADGSLCARDDRPDWLRSWIGDCGDMIFEGEKIGNFYSGRVGRCFTNLLLGGWAHSAGMYAKECRAARSARFEHGESGAIPRQRNGT